MYLCGHVVDICRSDASTSRSCRTPPGWCGRDARLRNPRPQTQIAVRDEGDAEPELLLPLASLHVPRRPVHRLGASFPYLGVGYRDGSAEVFDIRTGAALPCRLPSLAMCILIRVMSLV